jgi:hypothetical protein
MTSPIIATFTGTLESGRRVEHVQTGHIGTVVEHLAGSYIIRWDADLPVRTFEARLIRPVDA